MIAVAILGCDSTHAGIFSHILCDGKRLLGEEVQVRSVWGEDPAQANALARRIGLKQNALTIEESLVDVNLALVLGRFGDSHARPATVAIESGVATFVDKPFTTDLREAKGLFERAALNRVWLCSSSALRFSNELQHLSARLAILPQFLNVVAPANCTDLGHDPRLDSVFFYGIHALEMLLEVMGFDVIDYTISASKNTISAHLRFPTADAALHLMRGTAEFYEINWYSRSERQHAEIALDGSYNVNLLKILLNSVRNGESPVESRSTLLAIEILEQMQQAYNQPSVSSR